MHIKNPNKISILLIAINKIKNWYLLPIVYLRLYKKEFFILKLKSGFKIKLRTNSTDIFAFTNIWLLEEYKQNGFDIDMNDIVIDVGAHIGLFSIYSSQFCKHGKIFSFEPVIDNFTLLQENIKLNDLKNVYAFNKAVSKNSGILKIYLNESDQAAHSQFKKSDQFVETNAISLVDVFTVNGIEKCNFLKLDCEGSEFEILNSIDDLLLNKIEKISLEYHIQEDSSILQQLKTRFSRLNYDVLDFPSSELMGIIFAKNH